MSSTHPSSVVLLGIAPLALSAAALPPFNPTLRDVTIDSGGVQFVTGGGYGVAASIGQFDAATLTGGVYTLHAGFWTASCKGCLGDLHRDGVIDAADLSIVLGAWGSSPSAREPGDLDDDGTVDGADLAILLSGWGSCS